MFWTARCKSGYKYRDSMGVYRPHACNRVTPRYQLMCSDCLSAEVIAEYEAIRMPWYSRLAMAVINVFTMKG